MTTNPRLYPADAPLAERYRWAQYHFRLSERRCKAWEKRRNELRALRDRLRRELTPLAPAEVVPDYEMSDDDEIK